jgi:lipid-binding SYLF domain-containing protein
VINMSNAAIATFVVIGGIVWGGFLLIVATAVGKESRKAAQR